MQASALLFWRGYCSKIIATMMFLINENKSCKRLRLSSIRIILAAALAIFVITGYGRICWHAGVYLLERSAFSAEVKKHERLTQRSVVLNELVHTLAQPSYYAFPAEYAASHPSYVPRGIPSKGFITSHFGSRTDPVTEGTAFHMGVDIAQLAGKPVWATANGRVSFAGKKKYFGNVVEIDHFESGYKTIYAHMQTIKVKAGQNVVRGQQVGSIGTTGKSTGPHLHYEVHFAGQPVDPILFMVDPDIML
ncbi:MAG: M23 family metallopeptidase [Chitinispirillia bacterium]|nr:M23 family metallopeptidase [Chitinispirillia bacterium]